MMNRIFLLSMARITGIGLAHKPCTPVISRLPAAFEIFVKKERKLLLEAVPLKHLNGVEMTNLSQVSS